MVLTPNLSVSKPGGGVARIANSNLPDTDADHWELQRHGGGSFITIRNDITSWPVDDSPGAGTWTYRARAWGTAGGGNGGEPLTLKAFPEAEGFGAIALNTSRGLPVVVHQVTSLANSGAGTLRDILENQISNSALDIVIFRTGGTIELTSQIDVNESHVYIAGQTAPGDGIMIRSHPTNGFTGFLIRWDSNNVTDLVIRYLRFRHGQEGNIEGGGGLGMLGGGVKARLILDHVTMSWGGRNSLLQIGRTFEGVRLANRDWTIQNSLFGPNVVSGLGVSSNRMVMLNNPEESMISTDIDAQIYNISIHRNIMHSTGQRFPLLRAGNAAITEDLGIQIINNLLYNASNQFTEPSHANVVDMVQNYVDHGPHVAGDRKHRWDFTTGAEAPGSVYIDDVFHAGLTGLNQWKSRDGSALPSNFQRFTRMPLPTHPVTETTAADARTWCAANAGANQRLDAAGNWVAARDAVDTRVGEYTISRSASETPNDSGSLTVVQMEGGWPTYAAGTAPTDSDSDGIPDAWVQRWYSQNTLAAAGVALDDVTPSGYLLIEHYLNNSDPFAGGS